MFGTELVPGRSLLLAVTRTVRVPCVNIFKAKKLQQRNVVYAR